MHVQRHPHLAGTLALTIGVFGLSAGCGPKQNPSLETLRADIVHAKADPALVRRAPAALDDAVQALARADSAQHDGLEQAEVDHTIYVARRRLEIAEAQSTEKASEEEIARIGAQRERDVSDARANGAEQRTAVAQGELRATQRALDEQSAQTRAGERNNVALDARAHDAEDQAATARLNLAASERTVDEQNADARVADQHRAALELDLARLRHELDARETERGLLFTFSNDVLFDVGRSDIKSGSRQRLDRLAGFLNSYRERYVRVDGYTDSTGGASTNMTLSRSRADAVRTLFIGEGVAADHVVATGYGAESPVASNDSSAGREQNRRVEVVVLNPNRTSADAAR